MTHESKEEGNSLHTRWFKYDWDYLCVNKSQFVPVIFEPPCMFVYSIIKLYSIIKSYIR
jgi:hypothetical protein